MLSSLFTRTVLAKHFVLQTIESKICAKKPLAASVKNLFWQKGNSEDQIVAISSQMTSKIRAESYFI